MLDDIASQIDYVLTEVDIRNDPALFEEYRYRIPVIIIATTTMLEGRIEHTTLARAFDIYEQKG